MIKLFIIDDSALVRNEFKKIFADVRDIEIILKSMKKDREGLLFYYDVSIQYHKEKQDIDKQIDLLKKQIP